MIRRSPHQTYRQRQGTQIPILAYTSLPRKSWTRATCLHQSSPGGRRIPNRIPQKIPQSVPSAGVI